MADEGHQFHVAAPPGRVLDRAEAYLRGAGAVSPSLRGEVQRVEDRIAVRHGRVETTVAVRAAPDGSRVEVRRSGQGPLAGMRHWLIGLGLTGFLVVWAFAVLERRASSLLPPLVTITLFLAGLAALIAVLYVVDAGLERRSRGLVLGLEAALDGRPLEVLRAQVAALDRSVAVANGLLFYFAALFVELLVFIVLLRGSVREAIDAALAIEVMRVGFLLPLLPAGLYGVVFWWVQRRVHGRRLAGVVGVP